jgi:hypothetical protein
MKPLIGAVQNGQINSLILKVFGRRWCRNDYCSLPKFELGAISLLGAPACADNPELAAFTLRMDRLPTE